MKILLINHYAGSIYHGMEFRPYYIAREWVKMGHEIVIVASSFSHLRQKNPIISGDIQEEIIDGIRYIWIKTPEYHGNGVARIRNMLSFIRKLYRYLPTITKEFVPDAVIASSTYPLDSYPARWIAKKHNAKFVFELHDLWPMSPQVLGHMSKWHPFIIVMQMAEDYWCKNADIVISLLPEAYKHLVTHGMTMDKYHVVPNGVDVSEWTKCDAILPEEHDHCLNQLHGQGKFLVGYLGGHTVSYGLDAILQLAARVQNKSNIHFVMIGKGADKERLIKKAEDMGLSNITFLPPVPKLSVPDVLRQMDVLISVAPDTPLHQYGISLNKVFDYMMSERPVLLANNAPTSPVSASNCGFVVPAGDIAGLEECLLKLHSMSSAQLTEIGERGKKYILANYTYPILSKKFIQILNGEKAQ